MTSNTAQQDAAIADKAILANSAYADGRHLAARQSIYRWQQPRYDLPGIVLEELAGTSGIVLDAGCGNGKFVSRLHKDRPDLQVVGMDISAGILADVEKPVLVADAQALPFADDSADAVLALHMLYHVSDIEATIEELARVLRPGGVLIASTNSTIDKRSWTGSGPGPQATSSGFPRGRRGFPSAPASPWKRPPATSEQRSRTSECGNCLAPSRSPILRRSFPTSPPMKRGLTNAASLSARRSVGRQRSLPPPSRQKAHSRSRASVAF